MCPLVASNQPCTGDEAENVCTALGCTWSATEDSSCESAEECHPWQIRLVLELMGLRVFDTCTGDGDCPGNLQFCVNGTCSATESNNGDSSTLDWTSASDAAR